MEIHVLGPVSYLLHLLFALRFGFINKACFHVKALTSSCSFQMQTSRIKVLIIKCFLCLQLQEILSADSHVSFSLQFIMVDVVTALA